MPFYVNFDEVNDLKNPFISKLMELNDFHASFNHFESTYKFLEWFATDFQKHRSLLFRNSG